MVPIFNDKGADIIVLCAGFLPCPLACDEPDRPDVRGMMAPLVDSRRSAGQVLGNVYSAWPSAARRGPILRRINEFTQP